MPRRFSFAVVLTAAALAAPSAALAEVNLLQNGAFESGDLSAWATFGDQTYVSVQKQPSSGIGLPPGGTNFVLSGPVGAMSYLSQSFTDNAGVAYTVRGLVYGNATGRVDFAFGPGGDPVPQLPAVITISGDTGGWKVFSTTVVGTGYDAFAVGSRDDPWYVGLAQFSVAVQSPAVPEAPTWVMILVSFAGLGLAALRARRGRLIR